MEQTDVDPQAVRRLLLEEIQTGEALGLPAVLRLSFMTFLRGANDRTLREIGRGICQFAAALTAASATGAQHAPE